MLTLAAMWWIGANLSETIANAQQQAQTTLVSDATLTRAAECLAELANKGRTLTVTVTQYCGEVSGVYDGAVVPLVVTSTGDQDDTPSLARFFAEEAQSKRLTHYGAALVKANDHRALAVFAAERRGQLIIDHVPTESSRSATVSFHGTVNAGHRHIRSLATLPNGQTLSVPLDVTSGRQFTGKFSLAVGKGRYQIEILADAKDGPHVIANLALFIGVPPPPAPAEMMAGAAQTSQEAPETRMVTLMNHAREQAKVPALVTDALLAKIALAHANDMASHHFFAHISPTTGAVTDRVKAADYAFSRVAENLAAAPTVDDAFTSLMDSPGHRRNVLDPELRRVGVARVEAALSSGDAFSYFVVVFATPPAANSPEEVERQILLAVNQARLDHHGSVIASDPLISRYARQQSQAMADRDALVYVPDQQRFLSEVAAAANGDINSDLFLGSDGQVVSKSQNLAGVYDRVGIGVVTSHSARYGNGQFWITVLYVHSHGR